MELSSLLNIITVLFVVIGVDEAILLAKWNTFCFSKGILIYSKKIEINDFAKASRDVIYFIIPIVLFIFIFMSISVAFDRRKSKKLIKKITEMINE